MHSIRFGFARLDLFQRMASAGGTTAGGGKARRPLVFLINRHERFGSAPNPGQTLVLRKGFRPQRLALEPPHQQQYDDDDDYDPDDAHATVTVAVAVAAETTTEAAEQE